MSEEKYTEIISTYQTVQIQPDTTDTNKSSNSIMIQCRICLEQHGPFIVPCKCDGTMKHVHQNCLKKWASQRMKKQVQKDQEKAQGKLSNVHGIQCELCKQNISMEVRKLKKILGCNEAKQNSQDNFLPFLPLAILNLTISLGCFSGALFIAVFSILLFCQSQLIDCAYYNEHPLMIWSLLSLGMIFSVIFMVKSIIEMYQMFIKEEYQVIRVIANPILLTASVKITQPDCPNTKWFSNLQPLSTPTSPHSVRDQLLINKLSLTRKNLALRQKIARETAQKKLQSIKEVKKLKQFSASQQTSVCSVLRKN